MSVECQVNVKSQSELDIDGRETCTTYFVFISVFLASSCLKHTSDLSLNTWKSAVACCISSDRALLRFLLCITVITMTMKPATMTALKITELQVLSPMINVWYYSEIKVKMSVDVDTPVCNEFTNKI